MSDWQPTITGLRGPQGIPGVPGPQGQPGGPQGPQGPPGGVYVGSSIPEVGDDETLPLWIDTEDNTAVEEYLTEWVASNLQGWNDLRVSLSAGRPNTSPPTFSTFRGGVQAWAFGAASTEQLYFEAQLPHGWEMGTEIRPHIHWSPGNSTNTGSVRWELEYTWQNAGDEVFPAPVTLTVDQAAAGVAYAHQIAQFPAIDGTGKRESSVFLCRIARVGGNAADTFTGSAFGISVDFHYRALRLGSADEYPTS